MGLSEVSETAAPIAEPEFLLRWEPAHSRSEWVGIAAASVAIHIVLFVLGVQIPSLVSRRHLATERISLSPRIALYLPSDVLAHRYRGNNVLGQAAKSFGSPAPPRRFEPPPEAKTVAPRTSAQAVPEAPKIAANLPPATLPPGAPTGLVAPPPPPKPEPENPFQDVGGPPERVAHPQIAAPKAGVQSAIAQLQQSPDGQRPTAPPPPPPGATPETPGGSLTPAIQLKSDPRGADLRPYLREILNIVRANWQRVVPASVRSGQLRGQCVAEFVISREGGIPSVVIGETSGFEPLDRAALAGISMSNPLPPLPSDYKGLDLRLSFTFSYNMPK